MFRKTRVFCFTMAIFFLISCFTAVPCYASSTENVTPEAQAGSGNIPNDGIDAGQNGGNGDEAADPLLNGEVNSNENDNEEDSGTNLTNDNPSTDNEDKSSQEDSTQDQTTQDETTQDQTTQDETAIDASDDDQTTDEDNDASQNDASDNGSNSNKDTASSSKTTQKVNPKNDESLWYISKISMKKEHQKLLWDYCKLRKIDYIDMLALIDTESNFNEKANGKYKGYFQFSPGTCVRLAKALKTPNTPLDGKININWGTSLYSSILKDKRVKNLTGKKKRDVALSIFQRGTEGYDRYGISTGYLKAYYKKWNKICAYLKKS